MDTQAFAIIAQMQSVLDNESPEMGRIYRYVLLAHHDPVAFACDEYRRTPIHYAATIQSLHALQYYLHNQLFDVNQMDVLGETGLVRALHMWDPKNAQRHLDIAVLLLAHGADPNLSPYGTPTPLMHAVLTENPKLVEYLLLCGADPRQPLENAGVLLKAGETALSLAVRLNTLTDAKSSRCTQAQLDIVGLLVRQCSTPSYVFHALQHAKQPLLKEYIKSCMRAA